MRGPVWLAASRRARAAAVRRRGFATRPEQWPQRHRELWRALAAAHGARGRVRAEPRCPPHPPCGGCPQAGLRLARGVWPGPRALGGLRCAPAARAGHAGNRSVNRHRRRCRRRRHPWGESPRRGDEIPGLGVSVPVPVRGRDDSGALPEQHLPLPWGPHVAGADAALLLDALCSGAVHAPLRPPRPQPRSATGAAHAPAPARAPVQVRAEPRTRP